jgi:hypothetical protein
MKTRVTKLEIIIHGDDVESITFLRGSFWEDITIKGKRFHNLTNSSLVRVMKAIENYPRSFSIILNSYIKKK